MQYKIGPDSHGAVNATLEAVVITVPVTGWYKLTETAKEIFLQAGAELILNGPMPSNPVNGTMRIKHED